MSNIEIKKEEYFSILKEGFSRMIQMNCREDIKLRGIHGALTCMFDDIFSDLEMVKEGEVLSAEEFMDSLDNEYRWTFEFLLRSIEDTNVEAVKEAEEIGKRVFEARTAYERGEA